MAAKICIFCGNRPQGKNKEHVIPQWLIRLTGKPSRKVYLGRDWSSPELTKREYSLTSFTFPACESCNSDFSDLESFAKKIIERLLIAEPVSAVDFDVLLDWFDKVRVGLWIGLMALNKNYRGTNPQFHIKKRVTTRDRMLIVYQDHGELDGISIAGVESPIFHVMPSCFGLSINHLHFFNASTQDLISKFVGLPYLTNRKLSRYREGFSADVVDGSKVVLPNLLPYSMPAGGTAIFQAIIPPELRGSSEFNDQFVIDNCMNHEQGRGKIFAQQLGPAKLYPETASSQWIPPQPTSKLDCISNLTFLTDLYDTKLYMDRPDMGDLTPEQIEYVDKNVEGILKLHKIIVEHHMRQLEGATSVERYSDTQDFNE